MTSKSAMACTGEHPAGCHDAGPLRGAGLLAGRCRRCAPGPIPDSTTVSSTVAATRSDGFFRRLKRFRSIATRTTSCTVSSSCTRARLLVAPARERGRLLVSASCIAALMASIVGCVEDPAETLVTTSTTPTPAQTASTAGAAIASSPTATRAPAATPATTAGVVGVVTRVVSLRTGPDSEYPHVGTLESGFLVVIVGRTPDQRWVKIALSGGLWLKRDALDVSAFDLNRLAVTEEPPPSGERPTPP